MSGFNVLGFTILENSLIAFTDAKEKPCDSGENPNKADDDDDDDKVKTLIHMLSA